MSLQDQKDAKKCECEGTEEDKLFEQIANVIDLYRNKEGSLIQVLHIAQQIYGYLPLKLQEFIARNLDLPLSEVTGVVSFYSFFSTVPRGRHIIRVCMGTACYVRGGKRVVENLRQRLGIDIGQTTLDKQFSLEVARCIGACGLAPAMMIDSKVYKQVNTAKLGSILSAYQNADEKKEGAV